MIDTGGTITKAADALFEAGAADVIVAATHAVLSGPAVDRLKNSRISEVVVTDTLPINEEQRFDKLTVLSIAPLIARGIREVFDDGSVTSLFDGAQLTGVRHGEEVMSRIAPGADVDPTAEVGEGTLVWHLAQVREGLAWGRDACSGGARTSAPACRSATT